MLAATFILIQSRTKTPNHKSGIGEEVEEVRGRVPIQKTIPQVHGILRQGCPAASDLLWNKGPWQSRATQSSSSLGHWQGSSLSSLGEGRRLPLFPLAAIKGTSSLLWLY